MGSVANRLSELGIVLPPAATPSHPYVTAKEFGGMLLMSGQVSRIVDGETITGRVGTDITIAEGRRAAELCALNVLAQANAYLGDLDRIAGCLRLRGFVNSDADFDRHPEVINAASELLISVLGECGRGVRTALGAGSLPGRFAVEIDVDLEVMQ